MALCCDLSGGHWSLAVTDNPAFHSTHSSTETEFKSSLWQTAALTFALSDCISRPFFFPSLSLSLSFLTALHDHVSRRAGGMGLLVLIKFERKGANPLPSSCGFVLPSKVCALNYKFWISLRKVSDLRSNPRFSLLLQHRR